MLVREDRRILAFCSCFAAGRLGRQWDRLAVMSDNAASTNNPVQPEPAAKVKSPLAGAGQVMPADRPNDEPGVAAHSHDTEQRGEFPVGSKKPWYVVMVLCSLALGLLGGVLWAWVTPPAKLIMGDDGKAYVSDVTRVFDGYIYYVFITVALAVVMWLVTWWVQIRFRSALASSVFVLLCSVIISAATYAFGNLVAGWLFIHPSGLVAGDRFDYPAYPEIDGGAFLAGGIVAMLLEFFIVVILGTNSITRNRPRPRISHRIADLESIATFQAAHSVTGQPGADGVQEDTVDGARV